VTDRSLYDPTEAAVQLLAIIANEHRNDFTWIPAHFDRLAGGSRLRTDIAGGTNPTLIVRGWRDELKSFMLRRRAVLLYPE
jgi:uncharacterized protein YbbC (DUF1343 family)